MGRKRRTVWYGDTYWQSSNYNQIAYQSYRDQIINIACSRFKWLNLPPTCDERYLERTLLFQGCATIAHPKTGPLSDCFFSTMLASDMKPNVYDNYVSWKSIGNDGWNFDCDPTNGVVVWDNRNRTPLMPMINLLARELADILRTKQLNRLHQKMPYVLVGPESKKQDMTNIFKSIAGNEPAIIATNGIQEIDVQVLSTEVPYLAGDFEEDIRQTWNTVYTLLGIENVQEKRERQIYGELNAQRYPDQIMENNFIECRREAARLLNARFGLNIEVVKARDNISDNFNLLDNIMEQAEIGFGDGGEPNGDAEPTDGDVSDAGDD